MPDTPSFDEAAAHRYFASHCFNRAWDIMEQSNRTPEDDRLMLLLSHASLYHWQERDDCTPQRLSIGYWQASRIQSLLGDAAQALIQAQTALGYSTGLPPFYLGYAYEAIARAHSLAGNTELAANALAVAESYAAQVTETAERDALRTDLATIGV